jgi:hypothetical protein
MCRFLLNRVVYIVTTVPQGVDLYTVISMLQAESTRVLFPMGSLVFLRTSTFWPNSEPGIDSTLTEIKLLGV